MRYLVILGLALLPVITAPASAQEAALPSPAPAVAEKSASKALFLAAAHTTFATSVGFAMMRQGVKSDILGMGGYYLFLYGTMAAPSAGNFYARDDRRTRTGVGIRVVGGGVVLTSLVRQFFTPAWNLDNPDCCYFTWDPLNVLGTGVILAGAAYSISSAPASVEEFNRRQSAPTAPRAEITPVFSPANGGAGVQVGVRF
jgi:hypothetical protein